MGTRICASVLVFGLVAGSANADSLQMTSVYPSSFPIIGEAGQSLGERLSRLTNGELTTEFFEPGALVAAGQAWDAVSTGAIDAAWYSPGFASGTIPSAAMFTSVPFGPGAPEYLAWYYEGGGEALWSEITAEYDIKSILCAALPPEASGWFREEITSVEQLRGMKMRIFGLGAQVLDRLGVAAQTLPVGDTIPALELGSIDAAEVSMPLLDLQLGFPDLANHYYFPGWHQQTSFFSLIINQGVWDGLEDFERAAIEVTCQALVTETIAQGEALQFDALRAIEAQGVNIHTWPEDILTAMENAWEEVVAEMSADDEDFRRVYESYSTFRANYSDWRRLGYISE